MDNKEIIYVINTMKEYCANTYRQELVIWEKKEFSF